MNQAVIPLAEPWLPPDCAEAVKRQVETTFVGPGAVAQSFATKLAETCGTRAAVTVASGTVALSIAAKVLGLQHGDEVVVPSYGVISSSTDSRRLACNRDLPRSIGAPGALTPRS